ncbi:hypothetical protein SA2016_1484 [Sinomonas atrocyanea]|uniref:Spore protein YkvP/CgeB glycosyl transferase-like domain-containing protein n=1 Tax=Sinomonas atrocyanea TaxID=37927 RepID=A0A126ZZY0_9MICC|nr:glycosyltransferase [Sinomonas atrocyanea]AMM32161.1 hypothetical protein SA2016_1484 [Sinomonas atrocyanea]GEB64761.1 hypothetical protein SAT01_22090 [Sinomonas atrocyanea]GGG67005.1 hypothetical protein GCM10007172_18430 [Sinomonas atrocyanea]
MMRPERDPLSDGPAGAPLGTSGPRPRLVWFRSIRAGLPDFLANHLAEQVRTMSRFFDVHVLDAVGDYDEICDRLEPDLCVLESGVYAGERRLANTASHPRVPKLGFLHADAFDTSRAAFIADMERWGVHSYFTTSMSMADYTPEIADRLFVWPNTVEAQAFAGPAGPRAVPVLLTGSRARHYPWRNAVGRVLEENFTTLRMPHFGWAGERGTERMAWGGDYARLLRTAVFVPTCGTMAHDLVRKHLEIPAAGACLVTERTPTVEAAGFQDMVNCVFADAGDVVERLRALIADEPLRERITAAGTALVIGHHAAEHRDQVLQWYRLAREHGPDTPMSQSWPDGRLTAVEGGRPHKTVRLTVGGLDRLDLAAGWAAVGRGDLVSAESAFGRALNYFFIPEAAVGMAHTALLQGKPRAAQDWVSRLLVTSFAHYAVPHPDPVFWAYQIRVHLCAGDLASAAEAARRFPALKHPELDRVRGAALLAVGAPSGGAARGTVAGEPTPTTAPVPPRSEAEWAAELETMRGACAGGGGSSLRRLPILPSLPRGASALWGRAHVSALVARQASGRLQPVVVSTVRARLSPLKRRLLTDAVSEEIARTLETEPIDTAVLVGARRRSRIGRAVEAAVGRNPSIRQVERIPPAHGDHTDTTEHPDRGRGARLVFVARSGWPLLVDLGLLAGAALIVLEGTTRRSGVQALERLSAAGYAVAVHEPGYRDGCAVLRRTVPEPDMTTEEGGALWSE